MNKINEADTLNEREEATDDQASVERQNGSGRRRGDTTAAVRAPMIVTSRIMTDTTLPTLTRITATIHHITLTIPTIEIMDIGEPYSYGRKNRSDYAPPLLQESRLPSRQETLTESSRR